MVDMTLIRPLNKGQGHSFWVCFVVCTIVRICVCPAHAGAHSTLSAQNCQT